MVAKTQRLTALADRIAAIFVAIGAAFFFNFRQLLTFRRPIRRVGTRRFKHTRGLRATSNKFNLKG